MGEPAAAYGAGDTLHPGVPQTEAPVRWRRQSSCDMQGSTLGGIRAAGGTSRHRGLERLLHPTPAQHRTSADQDQRTPPRRPGLGDPLPSLSAAQRRRTK